MRRRCQVCLHSPELLEVVMPLQQAMEELLPAHPQAYESISVR